MIIVGAIAVTAKKIIENQNCPNVQISSQRQKKKLKMQMKTQN